MSVRLAGAVLLACTILVCNVEDTSAQFFGSASALSQTIVSDPSIHGVGNAVSGASGLPGAASLNPALVGEDGTVRMSTNFTVDPQSERFPHLLRSTWLHDNLASILVTTLDLKRGRWAGSYQFRSFDNRWWRGEVKSVEASHNLAVAYDINHHWTIGAAAGVVTVGSTLPQSPIGEQERAISFDMGFTYKRELPQSWNKGAVSAAVSITDFGPGFKGETFDERLPLPTLGRVGIGYHLSSNSLWYGHSLWSTSLMAGLSKSMIGWESDDGRTLVPDGPFKSLITTWRPLRIPPTSLNEEAEVDIWGQTVRHVGAEAVLAGVLSARAGYFREGPYVGNREYVSVGFGLDLHYVRVDYSASPMLSNQNFWQLTGRIPLDRQPATRWTGILETMPRGMGVEIGTGHSELYITSEEFYPAIRGRTKLFVTPALRLTYGASVLRHVNVLSFAGYSEFGGRSGTRQLDAAGDITYSDRFRFKNFEAGSLAMFQQGAFAIGIGAKGNWHFRKRHQYSFEIPESLSEFDYRDPYTTWWGDRYFDDVSVVAGFRAEWESSAGVLFGIEGWQGLTNLARPGWNDRLDASQRHVQFVTGYRF